MISHALASEASATHKSHKVAFLLTHTDVTGDIRFPRNGAVAQVDRASAF